MITLNHITVKAGSRVILDNINWMIRQGEHWLITGPSGSGKTSLGKVLAGTVFHHGEVIVKEKKPLLIRYVPQQHFFQNRSGLREFYYQQRFNASDADDSQTVSQAIESFTGQSPHSEAVTSLTRELHLDELMNRPLIQLSNGENKRLQMAEALIDQPDLLVLDNPFIGLDTEGRQTLHIILNALAKKASQLVLLGDTREIPDFVTHVAVMKDGRLAKQSLREEFKKENYPATAPTGAQIGWIERRESVDFDFEYAIRMKDVCITYDRKPILKGINWEVKKGDCWAVSGPNGSGKSTLLSLVTADNPQAYANDIWLFDRKKGKGESIWDIKKKIGYVSPELHLNFEFHATGLQVVASGLFDTVGLFRRLSPIQEEIVYEWMKRLDISRLAEKSLGQLSTGEQRMLLLARALIKHPPLLVLDEPGQGLDEEQLLFFNSVVDAICRDSPTTLIYVTHYRDQLPSCITHYLELPV